MNTVKVRDYLGDDITVVYQRQLSKVCFDNEVRGIRASLINDTDKSMMQCWLPLFEEWF